MLNGRDCPSVPGVRGARGSAWLSSPGGKIGRGGGGGFVSRRIGIGRPSIWITGDGSGDVCGTPVGDWGADADAGNLRSK